MRRVIALMAWLVAVLMVSHSSAQPASQRTVSPPVVTGVFPPGASVGTTLDWTISGRGFSKVRQVFVSGSGLKVLEFVTKGESQAVASVSVEPGAETGYRELRVEGTDGVSNLVLVKIDARPQVIEIEPNDEPLTAQSIAIETSVAGVLRSLDIDHYRVEGPPGQKLTVDFEARRLGTSITPVMTILDRRGGAIAQARESRGGDHECRLAVKIPEDGGFVIQVRDNTYAGNDSASYRIRVTTTPFATALFPLGGSKGRAIAVTASGGSLKTPLTKTITLPNVAGVSFDPGPFDSPWGKVESPGTIVVGDDAEIEEGKGLTTIGLGQTANGRIDRKNEVDRYAMVVKKGQKFRVLVRAEGLGSWLDSVLVVKNGKGEIVGENDDFMANPNGQTNRGMDQFGLNDETTDSTVDIDVPADDTYTLEVTDRYADGGPEYGYRLSVGVTRPDFSVQLQIGNPNGQVGNVVNNRSSQTTPGLFGVFNLSTGTKIPVNFIVIPEGRPGPVTVRAEGLPDGVTVDPVKVDVLGPGDKGGQPAVTNAPSKVENLVFNVASYAYPGLSQVTIVATAEPSPGQVITRTATAKIGLEAVPSNVPARPITRRIDRFPLRIVGEYRPKMVGPPEAPRLANVRIPGVLLAGDRLDLGLDFDQSPLADPGFAFEARAKGVGLATNTVILSGASVPDSDEENPGDVIVRVLASPKAVPGVYPVSISYSLSGGKPVTREVSVIVRRPIEVLIRPEPITLKPGEDRTVWVGIRREPGATAEVELKVEGLPRGVKLKVPVTLKETDTEAELVLAMSATAKPIAKATEMRLLAIVRMPRGTVMVESRNRPMIVGGSAEEKGRSAIE